MDSFLLFLVVSIGALASSLQAAEIGSLNCAQKYQEVMKEAVSIKEECDGAAFSDCCQTKKLIPLANIPSGIYEIGDVCNTGPFSTGRSCASCDMETDGGGWTVIQRRINGSVDFYRGWEDYELGFGDLETEFWWGLKKIHCLTSQGSIELRIDMEDDDGSKIIWVYQDFKLDGPELNYRLHIGAGEGTPGISDSLTYHNNRDFSTFDQDNDAHGGNCALIYHGAWWYGACHQSNLNGPYPASPGPSAAGSTLLCWKNGGAYDHYPHVEMKIRSKTCHECNNS